MTDRTEREQRRLERKTTVFSHVANRALSAKTTGLDGLAKSVVARQAGGGSRPTGSYRSPDAPSIDPELRHPEGWDHPID